MNHVVISFMWLLNFLSSIPTRFRVHAEPATIDMTNTAIFERVAKLSIDLCEDIYCNTLDQAECGDNFYKFTTNPRYSDGTTAPDGESPAGVVKNEKIVLPKMLVWDWNGDSQLGIPKTRFIILRGTHSLREWEENFECQEKTGTELGLGISGYFHQDFGKTGKRIWDKMKKFIENCDMPIVITGHSRGGALAEILHVVAKKNHPTQPIYCFAHAPPPSMKLDSTEVHLADDIYGFINGNDPIPRFSVNQVFSALCYRRKAVCASVLTIKTLLFDSCKSVFDEETCSMFNGIGCVINVLLDFIASSLEPKIKTLAAKAITNKKKDLIDLFQQYYTDPTQFHVTGQVGHLYSLDWVNQAETMDLNNITGCAPQALVKTATKNIKQLIEIPKFATNLKKNLADHDPRFYRHAIQDPVCTAKTSSSIEPLRFDEIEDFMAPSDYNQISGTQTVSIFASAEPIEYPSWMPSFADNDDSLTCDTAAIQSEDPSETYVTTFSWNSIEDDWECDGVMENCNITRITGITCTNLTHVCQFNVTSSLNRCMELPNKVHTDDNRCMSTDTDYCDYYSKSSSKNDRSSSGSSNQLKCNDTKSCNSRLSSQILSAVYVGGNDIVDIKMGYSVMRKARQVLGRLAPPPEFQHTAVWVGPEDSSDQSPGSIVVYGQYLPESYDGTYLSCDGARSYDMTLGEFKEMFNSFNVKKLKPAVNMTLNTFLDKIKYMDKWRAEDYSWHSNNCQHFTAQCLHILQATRTDRNPDDWMDIPSPVMDELILNEFFH